MENINERKGEKFCRRENINETLSSTWSYFIKEFINRSGGGENKGGLINEKSKEGIRWETLNFNANSILFFKLT